jgi:hypothetical protein
MKPDLSRGDTSHIVEQLRPFHGINQITSSMVSFLWNPSLSFTIIYLLSSFLFSELFPFDLHCRLRWQAGGRTLEKGETSEWGQYLESKDGGDAAVDLASYEGAKSRSQGSGERESTGELDPQEKEGDAGDLPPGDDRHGEGDLEGPEEKKQKEGRKQEAMEILPKLLSFPLSLLCTSFRGFHSGLWKASICILLSDLLSVFRHCFRVFSECRISVL